MKFVTLNVVDDDEDYLEIVRRRAEEVGTELQTTFDVTLFTDTTACERDFLRLGYPGVVLCDMLIPENLGAPEMLYHVLHAAGRANTLCYMTTHISPHDMEVGERTGVPILLKETLLSKPVAFFRHLLDHHFTT